MAEFLGKCLYFSAKYSSAPGNECDFFTVLNAVSGSKAFSANIWLIRNKFGLAISHGRITRIFFFAFSTKPFTETPFRVFAFSLGGKVMESIRLPTMFNLC